MSVQLNGRVALVSGGGRGIGRGICELLASHGASVAVNYRKDKESALETVDAIIAAGGSARAYEASVDNPEAVAIMVDQVVADFGYVDILVCNAGIASRGQAVADTDPNEVLRLLNTHAIGPHHLSRCVLPSMRTRDRGDIIMISSVIVGFFTDRTRSYYVVTLILLVLGVFALAECGVSLDTHRAGDVRWSLLVVSGLLGPLLPLATELTVELAYPLSENTVLVILQLSFPVP